MIRFGTPDAAGEKVTHYYNPNSEDSCFMCLESDGGPLGEVESDGIADWVIGGYPLCQPHAVLECQAILTSPGSFLHSWPTDEEVDGDWHGYVPFDFEIHMVRPVSYNVGRVDRAVPQEPLWRSSDKR
jgi:hypothetical protein